MASLRLPLFLACLLLLSGTWPAPNPVAQENRTSPPPQNVKVLMGLDGAALRAEMRRISTALGVDCDHCHVQGNFASDEKRPKRMALWMLELTRELNGKHFAAYEPKPDESRLGRVTCFTCHRGAIEPPTAPPIVKGL